MFSRGEHFSSLGQGQANGPILRRDTDAFPKTRPDVPASVEVSGKLGMLGLTPDSGCKAKLAFANTLPSNRAVDPYSETETSGSVYSPDRISGPGL